MSAVGRRCLLFVWLSLCAGDGESSDPLRQGLGGFSEGGICYRLYLKHVRGFAIGHYSLAGSFGEPFSISVLSHTL